MRKFDPAFGKNGLVEPKEPFSAQLRVQRVEYCLHMQQQIANDPNFMTRIFWVDLVYLVSSHQSTQRWCQRRGSEGKAQHEMVLECPMMHKRYRNWTVYYYSITNAILGAFLMLMMTGTKGPGAPQSTYMVRAYSYCTGWEHWVITKLFRPCKEG